MKLVEAVPSELETTTETVIGPVTAGSDGTTTTSCVLVLLEIVNGTPLNVTVVPVAKPVPVIVTASPAQPKPGEMPVIVVVTGAGGGGGGGGSPGPPQVSGLQMARAPEGASPATPNASTARVRTATTRGRERRIVMKTDRIGSFLSVEDDRSPLTTRRALRRAAER